ncbi:hypothetical protein AGIG_G18772 [Arapaima gigas]
MDGEMYQTGITVAAESDVASISTRGKEKVEDTSPGPMSPAWTEPASVVLMVSLEAVEQEDGTTLTLTCVAELSKYRSTSHSRRNSTVTFLRDGEAFSSSSYCEGCSLASADSRASLRHSAVVTVQRHAGRYSCSAVSGGLSKQSEDVLIDAPAPLVFGLGVVSMLSATVAMVCVVFSRRTAGSLGSLWRRARPAQRDTWTHSETHV